MSQQLTDVEIRVFNVMDLSGHKRMGVREIAASLYPRQSIGPAIITKAMRGLRNKGRIVTAWKSGDKDVFFSLRNQAKRRVAA